MNLQSRAAVRADLPFICETGVRAFRDYPLYTVLNGHLKAGGTLDAFLADFHHVFFSAMTETADCRILECDGAPAGSYILIRPDTKQADIVRYLRCGALRLLRHAPLNVLLKFLAFTDDTLQGVPPLSGSHWHLHYLAVDPAYQGKGFGKAAVTEHVVPYVRKRGGTLLTLTTNLEGNVRMYQKTGFAVTHDYPMRFFDTEIHNWVLVMEQLSCYNEEGNNPA